MKAKARCVVVVALGLGLFVPALVSQGTSPLARRYQEGEAVAYTMQATNEGHTRTVHYEARAEGTVKRDAVGTPVEELAWTKISFGGQGVELSPASREFRQSLSLVPGYKLAIPDLSKVQPFLIGPIVDLLTFYADIQLAMKQTGLVREGDHVYVKHGMPNSWADGRRTIFGQDSVDFDITLSSVDGKEHLATLIVRHVPPPESRIPFPVEWMSAPVEGAVNNWAQVQKADGGGYLAGVGHETFEATIKLSLPTGRIVSATLENPVDVAERDCEDAALAHCGTPVRYRINRKIAVEAVKP